jgi:hypothetical protein
MTPAFLREPTGHSVSEAAMLEVSFPPFSTLVAEVSLFAEQLGQGVELVEVGYQLGSLLVVDFLVAGIGFGGWVVAGDHVLVGVLTVDQGNERWAAQGGGDVTALEKDALLGKLVQMRGLDFRIPHESVIGPRLIIRNDIENVGRFFGGCESATEEEA